ncbi:MAG TPA: TraR/DksA family transcriptional regulator [Thermomicrobiaceae bacterium]|nr:TraR/DksA family transcriptional regulator [Thermomicrobiaceae bacterium]
MRPPGDANIDVLTIARGRLLRRRDDLRQLRDALSADLGDSAASQGAEGVLATHLADAASDLVTAETSLGDLRGVDAELAEIDQALQRIERGTYGRCIDCGEPIDPARLRALPTAARCFRCQERHERAATG